ncbi:Dephospho-CoA kinase [Planctomycetes bacterium Pan216]|uniref:Dephospho-CoA kinase n=1 Tax=Kolteria novifilia TaxID=2527975 RepID=A0A518BA04_9BACT|nr:Dephospho-CoA kinase [Planctomycetes bacterium Pan216]
MSEKQSIVIGVTGSIGAGKSFVAQLFTEQGAVVIDADRVGHEVLQDREVIESLVERFGDRILKDGDPGNIDRRVLGRIVFGDPDSMRKLEELVHPRMRRRFEKRIAEERERGKRLIVLDAAILAEAGWDDLCDHVVAVDAPRAIRLERLRSNRSWTDEELTRREAAQWPLDRKWARADLVLENVGSKDEVSRRIARLVEDWSARANRPGER